MNHGEEFQNFRLHLEKQFRDLRLVKDPEERKIKAENAFHELNEVQIHAINQKMSQIKKTNVFLDGIIAVGSLLAAIPTSGWSIIATAGRGVKPFMDSENQIKQNPAFFLWKVKKSSK